MLPTWPVGCSDTGESPRGYPTDRNFATRAIADFSQRATSLAPGPCSRNPPAARPASSVIPRRLRHHSDREHWFDESLERRLRGLGVGKGVSSSNVDQEAPGYMSSPSQVHDHGAVSARTAAAH